MVINELFSKRFVIQSNREKLRGKRCCICNNPTDGRCVIDIDNEGRYYACPNCAWDIIEAMSITGCQVKMSDSSFYARKRG